MRATWSGTDTSVPLDKGDPALQFLGKNDTRHAESEEQVIARQDLRAVRRYRQLSGAILEAFHRTSDHAIEPDEDDRP